MPHCFNRTKLSIADALDLYNHFNNFVAIHGMLTRYRQLFSIRKSKSHPNYLHRCHHLIVLAFHFPIVKAVTYIVLAVFLALHVALGFDPALMVHLRSHV